MRPTARPQSAIRAPLNHMLGTEANVRILRVLVTTEEPIAPTEIATAASLNLSGVVRALSALEESGIVAYVGVGRRPLMTLRRRHPLARAIEALFAAEQERYDTLIARLRDAAGRLSVPPKGVWVEESVGVEHDRIGGPIRVAVLTTARQLDDAVSALQADSAAVGEELDVTIEVRGLTEADLTAMQASGDRTFETVEPIYGAPPNALLKSPPRSARRRTHADADDEARALGAAIAEQLKRDPTVIERAQRFLAHRLTVASKAEQRELREWDAALRQMSAPRLRRFLVDRGERATRLRQSMPFFHVLTPPERARVRRDAVRARLTKDASR